MGSFGCILLPKFKLFHPVGPTALKSCLGSWCIMQNLLVWSLTLIGRENRQKIKNARQHLGFFGFFVFACGHSLVVYKVMHTGMSLLCNVPMRTWVELPATPKILHHDVFWGL